VADHHVVVGPATVQLLRFAGYGKHANARDVLVDGLVKGLGFTPEAARQYLAAYDTAVVRTAANRSEES
jgi:hypothetical protein